MLKEKDEEIEIDEINFYIDSFRILGVDFSQQSFTEEEYDKIETDYINNRYSLKLPYSTCCRPSISGRFDSFCQKMDIILNVIRSRVI
jgi:hypothetical protein